jgi:transposase
MKPYSEDPRKKIVAVERGMSKSETVRLFDVSLSSVKRYARMVSHGLSPSLAPKEHPGSKPKLNEGARKLLEVELQEHPTVPRDRVVCSPNGSLYSV